MLKFWKCIWKVHCDEEGTTQAACALGPAGASWGYEDTQSPGQLSLKSKKSNNNNKTTLYNPKES